MRILIHLLEQLKQSIEMEITEEKKEKKCTHC